MNTCNTSFKPLSLMLLCAGLLITSASQAGLKKWVDENGQVHYGDRVPARYLKKEHYTINEQGVTVGTTEAQKTEAERKKEEAIKKIRAERNEQELVKRREQALRDRVLLDTFTTENDLAIARDERLDAIDSQISLAETLITNDKRKLESVKQRISRLEASGRNVPENLRKEIAIVNRQLENHHTFVEDKNSERTKIIKTYEADVKRFRELKAAKKKQ